MRKVKASERVYRAEFLNWVQSTSVGNHVERGGFVVEVARWDSAPYGWAAMINGDRGRVLLFRRTADKCKAAARAHFEKPRTDWVAGYKERGEWFPLVAEGVL